MNIVPMILLIKTPSKNFEIYFLNVGQGDAILFKTPDQKYILIDGGPDDLALKEVQAVIPFWHKRIDVLVLTHPDSDHVGGLPDILNYYDVKEVVSNEIEHNTRVYHRFNELVSEEGSLVHSVNDLKNFRVGCCVYFDTLWPKISLDSGDFVDEPNEFSVGFVVYYKHFSLFTAGDLGFRHEEEAVRGGEYDVDVLKVDHHGSLTSTSPEFLKKTKPEIAIIPVGERNRYGHPKAQILANLEESGAKIYRTDRNGRVKIVIGGEDYKIKTQKGN